MYCIVLKVFLSCVKMELFRESHLNLRNISHIDSKCMSLHRLRSVILCAAGILANLIGSILRYLTSFLVENTITLNAV